MGANVTFLAVAIWLFFMYSPPDSEDRSPPVPILVVGPIIEARDAPSIAYGAILPVADGCGGLMLLCVV